MNEDDIKTPVPFEGILDVKGDCRRYIRDSQLVVTLTGMTDHLVDPIKLFKVLTTGVGLSSFLSRDQSLYIARGPYAAFYGILRAHGYHPIG